MDLRRNVWITNSYFTGHPEVIWPSLKRSVSQVCREGRGVGLYYIGVASGLDHVSALASRIDLKKKARDTTHMYLLYQSTTERYTRRLEDWLIEHFRDLVGDPRVWNDADGGGGRPGAGPNYYLYLAVTKF